MISLEKLLKALEIVRGTNTHNCDRGQCGVTTNVATFQSYLDANATEDLTKSSSDSSKTMASIALSLTQQSQNLLSKREHPLTTRDKLSLCQSVTESVISGTKVGSDAQKLISIGIETLMMLIDDQDPDVRMNADEALNRLIRSLSETHVGKILLELFKEIKKNGSVRSLRGALIRFGILCHHIRKVLVHVLMVALSKGMVSLEEEVVMMNAFSPQKCRAYVQNLLPPLNKIVKRPEENLQETLAHSLEKILPILGYFTNDNEVLVLLRAFLLNVPHSSASMRRSTSTCLILLCQHSRKPAFFFLWVLDAILQMLVPIPKETSTHLVLGALLILRSLAPHFQVLTSPGVKPWAQTYLDKGGGMDRGPNVALSFDQVVQVYEICLHYSSVKDHNIVTASLEALQALLQHSCSHLLLALTSPKGLTDTHIGCEKTKKLSSRAASQLSMTPSLLDDDTNLENLSDLSSKVEICDEDADHGSHGAFLTSEEDFPERPDEYASPSTPDSLESIPDQADCAPILYSDIEIGSLSDTSLLLGRKDFEIGVGAQKEVKKRKPVSTHKEDPHAETPYTEPPKAEYQENGKAYGNIGSFTAEDLPVKYLVRYLCSTFLLSGRPGGLISDRFSKVSIKVLALNCVGFAISLHPSLMVELLFIPEKSEDSRGATDHQRMEDVLLFKSSHDPQIRASVCVLVGQFIQSSLVTNGGQYPTFETSTLSLDSLSDLLCKLLEHNSSVTVRGAIAGLGLYLPELLHSRHIHHAVTPLAHLIKTASTSYWLIKVELCELFARLPLCFIDHLEADDALVKVHLGMASLSSTSSTFSHRVLPAVFLPLLKDDDQRVRNAAAIALTRLVPHMMAQGNTVVESWFAFVPCEATHLSSRPGPDQPPRPCFKGVSIMTPFDRLLEDPSGLDRHRLSCIDKSLVKIIQIISSELLATTEKYVRLGCLEALAELCDKYPPILHPRPWRCHIVSSCPTVSEKGKYHGLVNLLLALSSESAIAGDLLGHQFILKITAAWLAGRAVMVLKEGQKSDGGDEKRHPWSFLDHPKLCGTAESLVQHMFRILCVYLHILEGTVPSMRNSLVHSGTAAALSPIKRKSRTEALGEKTRSHSPTKADKPEEAREKGLKSGSRRNFVHLPEYIKLYDVLKSAHQNYKMSLEEDVKQKFCGLLQETLSSLAMLLELATMNEFGRLADELLQYLIAATPILPTYTILCGQQLLKCLFGSNLMALWGQIFYPSEPTPQFATSSPSVSSNPIGGKGKPTFFDVVFSCPDIHLKEDLQALSEGVGASFESRGFQKARSGDRMQSYARVQSRGTDKLSLSSYIRLFEPLVIKALKLYTVSSDVVMQRSVLELLINLVQIRVNYCLLDSEQIFIGYVIKQFEYIEEGQIKQSEELIPSMFKFLVLLSYERHHSKSIIGVPKIIQLCDGLMASGQPPLSHCVLALRPLVEDLFLERSHSSAVDQKELETQREVLCPMLLRLAHYYQVLQLLSIVLVSIHDKDKFRKLSLQILDVLLPRICKLQINIDSKVALCAIEEVLSSVCITALQPPDALLEAWLTSISEIDSTEGVERWMGGVVLLLRVLVTRVPLEVILERLYLLGLNMEYVRAEGEGVHPQSSLHQSLSPKRFSLKRMSSLDWPSSSLGDPLNATRAPIEPQFAIARFLLEVLRVSLSELKSLEFAKLQSSTSSSAHSDFLFYLTNQLLLILIRLNELGRWEPVISSFKTIIQKETEVVDELNECFVFCARWHCSLILRWCQLLAQLDCASPALWSSILQSSQRKMVHSGDSPDVRTKSVAKCLPLEFTRRAGFLLFADFVFRHSQEGEWLTWLVVQHISEIVALHAEAPVRALLQGISTSSAASALLIQAIHARCHSVDKAQYGSAVIAIVSGVHAAQSGPVLVFLIDRLIGSSFLVVSRSAAALCTQRLHLMLVDSSDTHLSAVDVKKLMLTMKKGALHKRYGQVYTLLQQLLVQQQNDSSITSPLDGPSTVTPAFCTPLDLNWYLQLVKSRCCTGEGGGHECGKLLSHLDYNDVLMVMSSKHFNLALMPDAFRLSLNTALQANSSWVDNSSVDTGDSEGSSVNEAAEPPLLSACKGVLLQQLNRVISEVPKLRRIFLPSDALGNEYTEELCKKLCDDAAFRERILVLSPSVIEFLKCAASLSWKTEMHPHTFENILSFSVLNLELLHWHLHYATPSVTIVSGSLACVNAALQHAEVTQLLASGRNLDAVVSMVLSLHAFAAHSERPHQLPRLPPSLESCLRAKDDLCLLACKMLMQLIVWIEEKRDWQLPAVVTRRFRGVLIALARVPSINGIVRTPPELWTLGWCPEIAESRPLSFPPIPAHLLQEPDVLKQFIFRIGLLGFIDRHQFEETWMHLLSVLNATPGNDTPPEEVPYINLSLSLAVRGITSLLVQTLLVPHPGNPHNSTLLNVTRDKPPTLLTTKGGQKLQEVMRQLHLKLKEVQHIMRGGPKSAPKYHTSQLSVEFLSSALLSSTPHFPSADMSGTSYESEARQKLLTGHRLDVQSCLHFLRDLFSTWLSPQSRFCSSVIAEVVKSTSVLTDLFTSSSLHKWVLETLVPLYASHPVEDHITSQYIILATCKALATLKKAKQEVSSSLTEGVLHIVEAGLRSIQVSVRTCALQGVLYLLQAPQQENFPVVSIATAYILKCNDRKMSECESHEVAFWETWVFLGERYSQVVDPTLSSKSLPIALTTVASPSTSPRILHHVLRGVERLILTQQAPLGAVEVVLKLAMDLVLHSVPSVSLAALPLFLTTLHCSALWQGANLCLTEGLSRPEDLGGDPELLLQFMEKLSVLFDRVRVCLPFEAGVLAGLLGSCLLEVLPASQLLNKVITEYISSHQPHPHLLASTLFQVFEAAMGEGGEGLVQEWVLLSLSNFTQRTPVALAVWCLTCFFIAASSNRWLRAAFPSVQTRLGRLEACDVQVFCLAGAHFRASLASQQQRNKFDDVFKSASTPGSPFEELIVCVKHSAEKKI